MDNDFRYFAVWSYRRDTNDVVVRVLELKCVKRSAKGYVTKWEAQGQNTLLLTENIQRKISLPRDEKEALRRLQESVLVRYGFAVCSTHPTEISKEDTIHIICECQRQLDLQEEDNISQLSAVNERDIERIV